MFYLAFSCNFSDCFLIVNDNSCKLNIGLVEHLLRHEVSINSGITVRLTIIFSVEVMFSFIFCIK